MFSNKIWYVLVLLIFSGCGTSLHAPKGSVPLRDDIVKEGYGAWVKISLFENKLRLKEGEFIALEDGSIYVLNKDVISRYSISKIKSGQIIVYSGKHSNNYLMYPKYEWSYISRFARFPQGLPEEIDITTLKSRRKE